MQKSRFIFLRPKYSFKSRLQTVPVDRSELSGSLLGALRQLHLQLSPISDKMSRWLQQENQEK